MPKMGTYIGSEQLVTINELVDIVEDIAGVTLMRSYNPTAPQGVRGRNSDNTLIGERLGWVPSITLEDGLQNTYKWIFDQTRAKGRRPSPADGDEGGSTLVGSGPMPTAGQPDNPALPQPGVPTAAPLTGSLTPVSGNR